jgi:hypothetical protein
MSVGPDYMVSEDGVLRPATPAETADINLIHEQFGDVVPPVPNA